MTETIEYDWGEVDVDEEVTEELQKQAEDLTLTTPVGRFVCTVIASKAIEKSFDKYSCIAAALTMRIDGVIEIEQTIMDNGKPLVVQGKEQKAVRKVDGESKARFEKMYIGKIISDEINLFSPQEKDGMRNRRIYVAKRFGLITNDSDKLTGEHWGKIIIGRKAIVETKWNRWKDKTTQELRENVKVAFSGYDYLPSPIQTKKDFSSI